MIDLNLDLIDDPVVRENFLKVQQFIKEWPFTKGTWRFYDVSFVGAVTNFKYPHNLGFIPKDVVQTFKSGAGTVTYNYDSFDATNIDITTTGAAQIRFFLGRYAEE